MGNWFSNNSKNNENNGQVSNSVTVETSKCMYDADMLILTAIICGIKIFEFLFFVYKHHKKNIQRNHDRKVRLGEVIVNNN